MAVQLKGRSPLYQQLRTDLHSRIRRGDFGPGQLLPSENQLCTDYGVSITTARRALLELVKEGVVQRRAGIGTTVAAKVRHAHLGFVSVDYTGDAWRENTAAMGELIAGIGEHAWRRDASFSMSGVDEDATTEFLRALVEARSVDGVLLRTPNDLRPQHIDVLEQAAMPYVAIKRDLAGRPLNCVVSDDTLGARIATEHLLERGHRRIGFVCAKASLGLIQSRLAGYRQAMAAAGLAFDQTLVRLESSFGAAAGNRAVRSLLRGRRRPTAIFAASDTMAIGGYQAVKEMGLRIPEHVALVGYDDIGPAAVLDPPLTTVRTSYHDFGRLAAELLLDLLDGAVAPPQRIVITPRLIVRESTGGPPAKIKDVPAAAQGDQLGGVLVQVAGSAPALAAQLRDAVVAAGGVVVDGGGEAAIWTADLTRNLSRSLAEARSGATRLCRSLARGSVLVAAIPRAEEPAAAAARAGLERLVEMMAAERPGVRVNGALLPAAHLQEPAEACLLLISQRAAAINGQVLELGARDWS